MNYTVYVCIIIFLAIIWLINVGFGIKTIETIETIETYDAKLTNEEFNNCMTVCQKAGNCAGFAYDEKKQICYLAQHPLLGKPLENLYMDEYDESQQFCNKMGVNNDLRSLDLNDIRNNATFICLPRKTDAVQQTSFHIVTENGVKTADTLNKLYEIKDPLNTNLLTVDIKFPKDKNDQFVLPDELTENEEIKHMATKETIDRKLNNLDELEKYYIQYIDFNDGEYLNKDSSCQTNISKYNCLSECTKNSKCLGVEYNPSYIKYDPETRDYKTYSDVCCMKQTIVDFNKRNEMNPNVNDYSYGSFYKKIKVTKDDNPNIYICNAKN